MAASAAGARAWSYRFNANASFGSDMWPLFGLPQCAHKVCHASELMYVFGNTGPWAFNDAEAALSAAIQTAWTNFAHTGDPNVGPDTARDRGGGARQLAGAARDGVLPQWPPFDNVTRQTLVLSFDDDAPDDSSTGNCAFWDQQGYAGGAKN